MLCAIACYFNPAGYRSKKRNYDLFRARLEVPLIAVELACAGGFELASGDADHLIRIRGGHENVLWQKERMMNIALAELPAQCTAVAWLDTDVVFENPDWPAQTLAALEHCHFVQPYEELLELERHQTLADGIALQAQRRSFASAHARGRTPSDYLATLGKSTQYGLAPGSAWAGRREILQQSGFYDAMIVGGGDKAMLNAMLGEAEAFIHGYRLTPAHAGDYRRWAQGLSRLAPSRIGFVPGRLIHLWHGNAEHRSYRERQAILSASEFDPAADIEHRTDRVWRWASAKPRMHRAVAEYFAERREDG